MDYNRITLDDVSFLHNAQLLMEQRHLPPEEIAGIVINPNTVVAKSPDAGVVVSQDTVGNRTVRVVISESSISGGSPTKPLVINTIVLGNVAAGLASGSPGA